MQGYYIVTETIKAQLELDTFVNTVNTGIIEDVLLKKQDMYPYSHILVNNSSYQGNTWVFNLSVICMDIVDLSKDEVTEVFYGNDNQQDVLNTQLAVINRLLDVLQRGQNTKSYILDGAPNCEPFIDRFEHGVAGWTVTFDIRIPNTMTVCDNDVTPVKLCPDFTYLIKDSADNTLYTGSILSGNGLTQTITDGEVTNSLGTVLANVLAQGSTELEDVDNIDSDGSTVPTPAGVPFTCTPAGRPAPESDSVTKPTILDRTFDLDETDLITTSGTIAGAVDGLLITSPEPPKSYINGSTQSGITTVEVNPSDYGWTAMQEYKMIAEFEITSAPVADGQYFGIGKKGRGEKSPRNGSCIYRYSTTNALTYTEYYQSSGTSSPTPSTGDIVKLEYIVTDGQVQVLTYLNGTYQGIFSQVYTLSNDLRGRIGTWCVFVYGCDVKLKTLEIIDVAGLTCDNLITGNSEHDGWGGFASNQNRNLHDTMSKSSSYITHNHSVSSSTALDHMNCAKEKARVCIKNHIIHLGTNEKILARADATIVNEIEALANAVLALKPNVNTYIVLIPPVNGTSTTALNTLLSAMCTTNGWETIDFATWARTSDTTWDSMYTSDNIHGNLNFKQRCFEEIASNNSELLIIT